MVEATEKSAKALLVDLLVNHMLADRLLDRLGIAAPGDIASREADDPALLWHLVVAVAVVQCWQ